MDGKETDADRFAKAVADIHRKKQIFAKLTGKTKRCLFSSVDSEEGSGLNYQTRKP
jgi:hypothetical protein